MGKLKDGLTQLSKLMTQIDAQAEEVCGELQRMSTSAQVAAGMVTEGYTTLYLYLFERFQKDGTNVADHKDDTIKQVADSTVAQFIKGIETQRPLAVKLLQQRADYIDKDVKSLLTNLTQVRSNAAVIAAMITKKKKKWLQSKKYKDKLKGYEAKLESMVTTASDMYDEVQMTSTFGFPKASEPVYKDAITANTTVAQLGSRVSALKKMQRDEFDKGANAVSAGARKIRSKNFAAEINAFKKWSAEADEMESEAD